MPPPEIAEGAGGVVLVSADGNSFRGLVKHLDGIGGAEIPGLEIPTGGAIVYQLEDDLRSTTTGGTWPTAI